jgi:hypothetical protein
MRRACARWRASSIAFASAVSCAAAEAACPEIPSIRHEADPHDLQAEGCDRFRVRPSSLSAAGSDASIVFGGEVRQRYEYTHNPGFGAEPQDAHGAWLQRYAFHSDIRRGRNVRVFAELHSALENGRAGGPSPVDENRLELQNAFLEGRFDAGRAGEIRVRAGRQEMELGSARLVSVRDGPNTRRTFDGVRVGGKAGEWTIDAFALKPRRDSKGVFDDSTDDSQRLWGVYATRAPTGTRALGLDAYYIVRENDKLLFDQGRGSEKRQTLGMRWFGTKGAWRWNIEPMVQLGDFGGSPLRAWTLASETGYTWFAPAWKPGVRVSLNVASGDRNRNDPHLQTFHPLYPRGNYFSEDSILGPQNFYNAHVFLTLQPSRICTLTVDYNAFWRLSTGDGVYRPNGSLLRSGEGSGERLVATALSLASEWSVNRHFTFTAIYSHFSPRRFLERTGPGRAVDFVELTARFRF